AWARASSANSMLYFNGTPTPELAEGARRAAEKAVALAPGRPEGYVALGDYHQVVAVQPSVALQQYAKGQRLAPGNADVLSSTARAEEALGGWNAALDHLKQAERLDPRSVRTIRFLTEVLLRLRRYPEARAECDRGLALAPSNLVLIERKAMTFLGEGDLAGARAVLIATARAVEPTALVVFLASYEDLVWVLDEGQRELLLRLTASAFDEDKGVWGLCLAQAYALKGDQANVRVYAKEARKALED